MILTSEQIINTSYKFQRIISLVPSLTELLSDLGLDKEVIGITKFCVHPKEWFESKTRVGGTKTAKVEIIRKLNPDLIITSKEENVKEQVEELSQSYNVLLTDVDSLDTAILSIRDIGKITGSVEMSTKMVADIGERFYNLNSLFSDKTQVRATYFVWNKPYMVAGGGTFINDMMNHCGLLNIFSDLDRYPEINLVEIKERGCDMILLSSEPYPFKEKHASEIKILLPCTSIVLADGEMFSWYGSRLLKSADYFESLDRKYINKKRNQFP